MIIIGITGKAKQGKSTVARMLGDGLHKPSKGSYFLERPIADTFKKFWCESVGIKMHELDAIKGDRAAPYDITHRKALENLGDWGRSINAWFWMNAWYRATIKAIGEERGSLYVLVPDVRTEEEAEWIRLNGGFIIHVSSTTLETIDSDHTVQSSPLAVDEHDMLISNDGTLDDLRLSAATLAAYIHKTHGQDQSS